MTRLRKYCGRKITTSKSLIDVSVLPVATNRPSGLNLAHLATFLCSETCRVSCFGKLLDEPLVSCITLKSIALTRGAGIEPYPAGIAIEESNREVGAIPFDASSLSTWQQGLEVCSEGILQSRASWLLMQLLLLPG